MAEKIVGFVMSGGVGSRLWPLSREDNPKQFHDFAGDGSMLAKTLRRLAARAAGEAPIYLIAAEKHAERVRADLAGVDVAGGGAIFEPIGRNTAAAVAVATLKTLEDHGDAVMLVVPSDHEISTDAQFWQTIEQGIPAALDGRVVVFGKKPTIPETGYGYIEVLNGDGVCDVSRFVEKPDLATAQQYVAAGTFYWNTGIFLFRAGTMRDAFKRYRPDIWDAAERAFSSATRDLSGLYLPLDLYTEVPSTSIDYAVMEKAERIAMVPAGFRWNDLGSWQSLLDVGPADNDGNVIVGDVVAIDCENSYFRSEGGLVSAMGLRNMAIVSTPDATFVAPVSHSQNVKAIVEQLEKSGRLETRFTPAPDRVLVSGAWRRRVHHWLFDETLPLWSSKGVDDVHGGFHEVLGFDGLPKSRPKRMRTMARQVYAFAVAGARGWDGPSDRLIAHGLAFMARAGRTDRGGWVRTLSVDGSVLDPVEDAYDQSCVLLALAWAHLCGNEDARRLGEETFAFLDRHLEDSTAGGYMETPAGDSTRRSNPHMHLLEAFLAWHTVTGDARHLERAGRVIELFKRHFFDVDSWTLGEFFDGNWNPEAGEAGIWTEPGHHFEWASLLVDYAAKSGDTQLNAYARKLYASAIANGLNRATGLAYASVSRQGIPMDRISRSWPQAEAIKAALALDGTDGPDLKPEVEARVGRLFRWHIDPAPTGLWIDRIDERGRSLATEVPASIFYHLVSALTQYLDGTEERPQ
ncbi:MAG: AGE family epimerase/isomerase [Rhizobiaceae bacterium]|nr:AGE family epimerase/isomerase [Rhizobiaceae bacterium]